MQTPKKGSVKSAVKTAVKKTVAKPKTGYAPNQNVDKSTDKGYISKSTNNKGKVDYVFGVTKPKDISNQRVKNYYAGSDGKVGYETIKAKSDGAIDLNTPDFKKSVDTTGYAAGKKEFTVNSITRKPGQLTTTKSAKIKRSQVNPTLDKMKKAAAKLKKGGTVKSKKK
jgi:hypothetical protein